jgi:DNA-binding Xre family transcriptional regulator
MDKGTLAQTVVRLRRERGFKSAEALAAATGISHSVLQNLEAGRKKSIDTDMLTTLCQVLNVSPYEFLPELARDDDPREANAVVVARMQLIEQLIRLNAEE